jgi:hypothetical protein
MPDKFVACRKRNRCPAISSPQAPISLIGLDLEALARIDLDDGASGHYLHPGPAEAFR